MKNEMADVETYKKLYQKYVDKQIAFNKAQIKMASLDGFMNKENIDAVMRTSKEVQDTFKECMDYAKEIWGLNGPPK